MEHGKPRQAQAAKGLLARLDRAAEQMNAFLLVLAIGLAVLDFTCFWIIKVHDTLPTVTRIAASPAAAAQPPSPASDTSAVVKPPSRPAGTTAGF